MIAPAPEMGHLFSIQINFVGPPAPGFHEVNVTHFESSLEDRFGKAKMPFFFGDGVTLKPWAGHIGHGMKPHI